MNFTFNQPLSEEIFFRKYDLYNEGSVESVLRSISSEISSVEKPSEREKWKQEFFRILSDSLFIPAGRIMANARPFSLMKNYMNCYVIPIGDSMEEIYTALREDALIGKMGGGVGFNISSLRPKNAPISKGGESSGPLSFLEIFDTSAKAIHTGGSRRCLPKGTKVHTRVGLKNIEDVKVGEEVLTSEGYEKVSSFFDQGEQETMIIKTANGDFECTPNHKMAVFNGCFTYEWKQAKDLRLGDKLVYVGRSIEGRETKLPEWNYKRPKGSTTSIDIVIPHLDKDIAWLFGLIFGDGYISLNESGTKGSVSISCGNNEPGIMERAKAQLDRFGVTACIRDGYGDCSDVRAFSNQLATYFRQFKVPNEPLIIPNFIMEGSVEVRAGFVAGLFDADGCCKRRPLRVVSTIYESLVRGLVDILNSLGIPSSVNVRKRSVPQWKDLWEVNLSNAVSVRSWDEIISPHSEKYFKVRTRKGFYQSGVYDFSWSREMFLAEGIRYTNRWTKKSNNMKLTTLERLIDKRLDIYPIEINGFSEGRVVETYDIEVENKHEFVANGFLTHNSAHICILNIDHPDIEEFITFKQGDENKRLTQFNISVGITDEFMKALQEDDADWDLKFDGKIYKTVKAKYLYNLITENMYEHNEPGVFFLDTVNENNNGYYMYDIEAPNPCGEQPLPPYGVCCLGALKLSSFVENPFTEESFFNFEKFKETIYVAVRFLDNVLSASDYPLEKVRERVLGERRIGLGFTALADTFAMMGYKYGDEDSLVLSNSIGKHLRDSSYLASVELAKEKGRFDVYDNKILESGFINKLPLHIKNEIQKYGLRNIALMTTAPTGTTSLSLGNNCSSGIEPIFALQYTRNVRQDDNSHVTQDVFNEAWLKYQAITGDEEVPEFFATSSDISLDASINIQEIFQEYIDASISKTIQLPDEFSMKQYQDLIVKAWEKGLKGITTYNPNGSLAPILSTKKEPKKESSWQKVDILPNSKKRPEQLPCDIYDMQVNKQRVVVLVGRDNEDNSPYEVFLTLDKDSVIKLSGAKEGFIKKNGGGKYHLIVEGKTKDKMILEDITSVFDDDYAIMCRLMSLALRHKIPLQFVVDQLNKTKRFDIFSRTMARVLKKYIGDGEKVISRSEVCPECSSELQFVEGCKTCINCGWSKC